MGEVVEAQVVNKGEEVKGESGLSVWGEEVKGRVRLRV